MSGKNGITRRQALGLGAAAGAFTFIPARVLGRGGQAPPSEKMNLAFVGCGAAGRTQINSLKSQNIVALCDVDWREGAGRGMGGTAAALAKQYPDAKRYPDWRVMLHEMDKQIDGVVVSTPDHTHAHCVITALKMGKHVMCEKPLGHSVHETRAIMAAEKKYKKPVNQTVIQGHASEDCRAMVEWLRDGVIGDVQEVHFYQYETSAPGAAQLLRRRAKGQRRNSGPRRSELGSVDRTGALSQFQYDVSSQPVAVLV